MARAQAADAVLLGAVGGPQYDDLDFSLKPERGLLRLRKEMDLYANLRPAQCFDALADFSSLKREVVAGLDIMIVRELTSRRLLRRAARHLHRGQPARRHQHPALHRGRDRPRRAARPSSWPGGGANKVCSMEKANVMESGVLWRQVVTEVHAAEYPDVALSHMYADAGAMQLTRWPKQFDVIVTDNLFGDLLSDLAAMLTGSLGMLPSASLGAPMAQRPAEGALRAGARLGPRHRREGHGQPDRLHPLLRHGAALLVRRRRRGGAARGGGRDACSPTASAPPTCSAPRAARRSRPRRWATRSSRRSTRR